MQYLPDIDDCQFLVIGGSHMYGYATPTSDRDYRGIVIPPLKNIFGLRRATFQHREYINAANPLASIEGRDVSINSLAKFIDNCTKGSMESIELLFADTTLVRDNIGMSDLRTAFVTQKTYAGGLGYALSEYNKAFYESVQFTTDKYATTFQNLCSVFNIDRAERDFVINYLQNTRDYSITERMERPNPLNLTREGEYNGKHAAHCLRLVNQTIEYLTTSHITYPCPASDLLKKIRANALPLGELRPIMDDGMARLRGLDYKKLAKSTPDDYLNDWYCDKVGIKE